MLSFFLNLNEARNRDMGCVCLRIIGTGYIQNTKVIRVTIVAMIEALVQVCIAAGAIVEVHKDGCSSQ